jgi:hypothetical protein
MGSNEDGWYYRFFPGGNSWILATGKIIQKKQILTLLFFRTLFVNVNLIDFNDFFFFTPFTISIFAFHLIY